MNKVVLVGRLTKDAELKTFEANERSVLNFTLAVNRDFVNSNNEREADFIPIVYWTEHAESLQKYLLKGRQICVSGKLRVRTYETPEKGKRYITEVLSDEIKFLDSIKEYSAI
jgi:single-strand DNA-binding protein